MKLSGESQAELIKLALIGVAVIGAVWYVKRQAEQAGEAITYFWDGLTDAASQAADMTDQVLSVGEGTPIKLPITALPAPLVIPTLLLSNTVGDKLNTFNPASTQNWAYQGANWIGEKVTGDEGFTLGGWLYDVTH